MRLTSLMCALVLITAAACSASLTAPPSGFPAAFTFVSATNVQIPSITSAGDSVIAVAMEDDHGSFCGPTPTASAGLRGDGLVVTVTRHPRDCPPGAGLSAQPSPFQVVVHDVPSGTRLVTVVLRLVNGDNATYARLASGTITLP